MPFDTQLNQENEQRFQNWVKAVSKLRGRDISKDTEDYDLRGYWINGGYKDTTGQGHMPDTYKKPNHPTFSNESIYHDGKNYVGGTWEGDSVFVPGATNLRTYGAQGLQRYFQQAEPGVQLRLPRF
ncbi:MAG: hypothetical protein JW795_03325 [Chitinivibrionales bacterium]|nr:hypothetical protein [Chitinivibrionales bacterium]